MVRSGLQQDVINMYRQGVRNAFSKPQEARPAFLLHLRYNFRVPKLAKRDYTAIEHQLRRMSRTLEMLSSPTVSRLGVSGDMVQWWEKEISSRRRSYSSSPATLSDSAGSQGETEKHNPSPESITQPPHKPISEDSGEPSGGDEVPGGTREGGGETNGGEQGLGDGKLPGPGGT